MKMIRLALQRETAAPVWASIFASAVCLGLVLSRILWTRDLHYAFLIWNLFLAWMPLLLSLVACEWYRTRSARSWHFICASACWLLFFPNAPYIFTDVIHLTRGYRAHFWVDLVLILCCALTGLVLGFLSLFLMQSVIQRMLGKALSWAFIAGVAGLSGIGIFVGRFLRLNSWDVLLKPWALSRGIGHIAAHPSGHFGSLALAGLFATFLFITYLMLYALTHLRMYQSHENYERDVSNQQI
jgi:uncharacterized membrane protein